MPEQMQGISKNTSISVCYWAEAAEVFQFLKDGFEELSFMAEF